MALSRKKNVMWCNYDVMQVDLRFNFCWRDKCSVMNKNFILYLYRICVTVVECGLVYLKKYYFTAIRNHEWRIMSRGSQNVYTNKFIHLCDVFFPTQAARNMQKCDTKPLQKMLCIKTNIIRMCLRTVMWTTVAASFRGTEWCIRWKWADVVTTSFKRCGIT